MARKPVLIELAGGKSQRQRAWEAMRGLAGINAGEFTDADVSRIAKVEMEPVRDYRRGLVAGGWLECVAPPTSSKPGRYQLARDNGAEAPRVRRDGSEVVQGRINEALWGALSVLDTFTAQVLSELTGVKIGTVKTYCLVLAKAGYIAAERPGKGHGNGGVATLWRTVKSRNTGPRAPMVTRLRAVYDPNLHEVVWSEGADEAVEACNG